MSACVCFVSAKSVCLWMDMNNGLHWHSTAWGPSLPQCVKLNCESDQYKGLFTPPTPAEKRRPSNVCWTSVHHQKKKNLWNQYFYHWSSGDKQICFTQTYGHHAEWKCRHDSIFTDNIYTCTHALTMTSTLWSLRWLWVQLKGHITSSSIGETFIHSFTHSFIHLWIFICSRLTTKQTHICF